VDLSEQVERKDAALAEAESEKARLLTALRQADEGLVQAAAALSGAWSAYREHASRSASIKPRAVADPFFTTRCSDMAKASNAAAAACRAVREVLGDGD